MFKSTLKGLYTIGYIPDVQADSTWKSINVIDHINKIQGKNHIIIEINA